MKEQVSFNKSLLEGSKADVSKDLLKFFELLNVSASNFNLLSNR